MYVLVTTTATERAIIMGHPLYYKHMVLLFPQSVTPEGHTIVTIANNYNLWPFYT